MNKGLVPDGLFLREYSPRVADTSTNKALNKGLFTTFELFLDNKMLLYIKVHCVRDWIEKKKKRKKCVLFIKSNSQPPLCNQYELSNAGVGQEIVACELSSRQILSHENSLLAVDHSLT